MADKDWSHLCGGADVLSPEEFKRLREAREKEERIFGAKPDPDFERRYQEQQRKRAQEVQEKHLYTAMLNPDFKRKAQEQKERRKRAQEVQEEPRDEDPKE